jgi:hypothetical protein
MQAHPRCHFRPHESCLPRPSCASCPEKAATRIPSMCARVLLSYPWLIARILLTQPGPPLPSSQASRRSVFDLSSACQTSAFGRRIEPWGTHGESLAQNSELLCMVLSLLCMRVVLDARASYRSQSHVCHRACRSATSIEPAGPREPLCLHVVVVHL